MTVESERPEIRLTSPDAATTTTSAVAAITGTIVTRYAFKRLPAAVACICERVADRRRF